MRKIILAVGLTLDGYIARRDGALDFLVMPKDYSMEPLLESVDTGVMGRKTLEAGLKMGGGSLPKSHMVLYVFSQSRRPGPQDGFTYVNESPAGIVSQLRKLQGKDIWLMGGGELAREFLKADLIDELHLGIVPVLLGEGIPLFPGGFPQRDFTLIESKPYSGDMISLKYERRSPSVRSRPSKR